MGKLHQLQQAFNNMSVEEKKDFFKAPSGCGISMWGKRNGVKKLYRIWYSRKWCGFVNKLKREYLDGVALSDKGA